MSSRLRVGFVGGKSQRLNERVIDGQWTEYLGQYVDLVKVAPVAMMRLFGGSVDHWRNDFPASLNGLAQRLKSRCEQDDIRVFYLNMPMLIPYLLMARQAGNLDLGFVVIAHCAGSEAWVKQWMAIAPWLTERDVLLTSTASSKQTLIRISPRYQQAVQLPLCIAMQDEPGAREMRQRMNKTGENILSIGRIEDVKNIDFLLKCFAKIHRQLPDTKLFIAGEYTGSSDDQITRYRQKLQSLVAKLQLQNAVKWTGPVDGQAKDDLFATSDVLMNFSTDPGETFGFNLIEAKTWGIPVIASRWDGFKDIVRHEWDGFLVDCEWSGALPEIQMEQAVNCGVLLLQDDVLRRKMSHRAREDAKRFDYRLVMPKVVGALEKAAARAFDVRNDPAQLARVPLSHCSGIYERTCLESVGVADDDLLSVLQSPNHHSYTDWMKKIKPLITHYAGRS